MAAIMAYVSGMVLMKVRKGKPEYLGMEIIKVYFTPESAQKLERAAAAEGISVNDFCKKLINRGWRAINPH